MKTENFLLYVAIREGEDGRFLDPLTLGISWTATEILIEKQEREVPHWCLDNPVHHITCVRVNVLPFELEYALKGYVRK